MRLKAAAAALDISVRTLQRRIEDGHLQCMREGGLVFIDHAEIVRYVERNTSRGRIRL